MNVLVSEDGPTAVEYAVMLALIIVVCLTAIQAVGTNASRRSPAVSTQLTVRKPVASGSPASDRARPRCDRPAGDSPAGRFTCMAGQDADDLRDARFEECRSLVLHRIAAMFPFWIESFWSSLPQVLTLLAASVAVVTHVDTRAARQPCSDKAHSTMDSRSRHLDTTGFDRTGYCSLENWHVKLVCVTLIVAAYIDGKQLRVPELDHLSDGSVGAGVQRLGGGLGRLRNGAGGHGGRPGVPACRSYSVGGMGAGDVKLMAGMGAWLGASITFSAFCVSAVVGAVMAVWMVWRRKSFVHHYANFLTILSEFAHIKDPRQLSQIAAERKPRMLLLALRHSDLHRFDCLLPLCGHCVECVETGRRSSRLIDGPLVATDQQVISTATGVIS